MSYFPACFVDGRKVALSHLEPRALTFAVRRLDRSLTVDIRFTNHCYTRGFDQVRDDPAAAIMDGVHRRVFDRKRYDLSVRLDAMIDALPWASVWLNGNERNYTFAVPVKDQAGGWYAMFFHLRKAGKGRGELAMVVESAYAVADVKELLRGASKVSFAVLCAKVFGGEKVKPRIKR